MFAFSRDIRRSRLGFDGFCALAGLTLELADLDLCMVLSRPVEYDDRWFASHGGWADGEGSFVRIWDLDRCSRKGGLLLPKAPALKEADATSIESDVCGWLDDLCSEEEGGKRKMGRLAVPWRVGDGGEGDVIVPMDTIVGR